MKYPGIQQHILRVLKIVLTSLVIYGPTLRAQENLVPQVTSPPPLKMISKEDRSQVIGAKDAKARIRISIELAEGHLAYAEGRTLQHDYDGAAAELGKYRALLEDAMNFLSPFSRDQNKTRDLYKRLELALRAHGPRLTAIRRITPLEYAVWVKELEDFARKGRTDALNSFYGHTVVKEPAQKPLDDKRSKKQLADETPAPGNKPL